MNIGAIAKYWGLGGDPIPEPTAPATSIPAGTWVPVDDTCKDITYSGKWKLQRHKPGDYRATCHYSNAKGSYAEYSFTGTAIRWVGSRNDNKGNAEVYIDGVLRKSVDTRGSSWFPGHALRGVRVAEHQTYRQKS